MPAFHQLSVTQTANELGVDVGAGLSTAEAQRRLEKYGRNLLPTGEGSSVWQILFSQFTDLLVLVLIGAAVISGLMGEVEDALVIMVIVVLNALLGTYQEYRAEQALAALGAMQVPHVRVKRDGKVSEISAEELVPGDIVLLQEGDRIPADGRLTVAKSLNVEEAALTGDPSLRKRTPRSSTRRRPG